MASLWRRSRRAWILFSRLERDSVSMAEILVGRWVMRTAALVLWRFWPPGPEETKDSTRQSRRSLSSDNSQGNTMERRVAADDADKSADLRRCFNLVVDVRKSA